MADEDGPTAKDRHLWSFSREEQRLLWVTFVGQLASFIVGVVIVGAAIGLARAAHADLAVLSGLTLGFGFLATLFIVANRARSRTQPDEPLEGWVAWWLRGVPLLASAIFGGLLLIWIGLAAGIH